VVSAEVAVRDDRLSTYDFDGLTRLVLWAHEHCCRISIQACNPGRVRIVLHRRRRDGEMWARHPTIEDAIRLAGERGR
jgi:hypothetical protein